MIFPFAEEKLILGVPLVVAVVLLIKLLKKGLKNILIYKKYQKKAKSKLKIKRLKCFLALTEDLNFF